MDEMFTLSRKELKKLVNDTERSATAIDLLYVNDSTEGIERRRKGKAFIYHFKGKKVKKAADLKRITSLVIPPAWEKVWICPQPNGHLQVTGYDVKNRKQYKYHPLWTLVRSRAKFYHLLEFGKALAGMRAHLETGLRRHGLGREKVLAAVVSVMQHTGIRIGNGEYEKLYGSFGLSTLKDKHANISRNGVRFTFKGKKGVMQDVNLKSKKLAKLVRKCKDIPGKELFQYYDEDGHRHPVDSGMVNAYIKEISGGHFTAKDFRTWRGTLHALTTLSRLQPCSTGAARKKNVLAVLDEVSRVLGNTRTVCRKYYVHPRLLQHYEEETLNKFLDQLCTDTLPKSAYLSREEEVLLKILES